MSPSAAELRERLSAAISEVTLAENALETALRELTSRPRAEKVTVTDAVSDAFARLRKARQELSALHELIADE